MKKCRPSKNGIVALLGEAINASASDADGEFFRALHFDTSLATGAGAVRAFPSGMNPVPFMPPVAFK